MSETKVSPVVARLLSHTCGHTIGRDNAGNSHVTIHPPLGGDFTIVAPTFDEAVTRALDIYDREFANG